MPGPTDSRGRRAAVFRPVVLPGGDIHPQRSAWSEQGPACPHMAPRCLSLPSCTTEVVITEQRCVSEIKYVKGIFNRHSQGLQQALECSSGFSSSVPWSSPHLPVGVGAGSPSVGQGGTGAAFPAMGARIPSMRGQRAPGGEGLGPRWMSPTHPSPGGGRTVSRNLQRWEVTFKGTYPCHLLLTLLGPQRAWGTLQSVTGVGPGFGGRTGLGSDSLGDLE